MHRFPFMGAMTGIALFSTIAVAQETSEHSHGDMLIFFVPSATAPEFGEQIDRLRPYIDNLLRQEIAVLAVVGTTVLPVFGGPVPTDGTGGAIRSRFKVPEGSGFKALFVDEEGLVLRQDSSPVSMTEVIAVFGDDDPV